LLSILHHMALAAICRGGGGNTRFYSSTSTSTVPPPLPLPRYSGAVDAWWPRGDVMVLPICLVAAGKQNGSEKPPKSRKNYFF
jgi:hypothetical protein